MPRLISCPHVRSQIALFALMLGSTGCKIEKALRSFDLCGDGPARIASVSLTPAQINLRTGDVTQLTATPVGVNGETFLLCAPPLTWDSSDSTVASITSAAGAGGGAGSSVVRAVAAGTTLISAHIGGQTASSTVTVSIAPLASLAIEPQALELRVGQTIRLSVSARDSAGNAVTVRAITWSSDDLAVATVSASGLLVAVESGTASVRATVEKLTVVARIPVTRDPPAVRMQQISAGYMHTCAIASGAGVPDGSAYCWGEGAGGRLGNGGSTPSAEPIRVTGAPPFLSIAAGQEHTCAISTNDATYCWGANQFGQLGDATLVARPLPGRVVTALVFRSIAVVAGATCALVDGGAAYCWGTSLGNSGNARTPVALAGGLRFAELIDGGWSFMCGRTLTKQVYCWGQLANRTLSTPTLMSGALLFEQVDAGTSHVCGVVTTGESYCWGSLGPSLLGRGVAERVTLVPTLLQTAVRFSAIFPAGTFTCGVADSGAYCLGNSSLSGFDSPSAEPHQIPDETRHRFVKISGGGFHACAIDTTGGGWCWGRNYEGQLGGGEALVQPATPRQVLIR